jgi:hypothetical protein
MAEIRNIFISHAHTDDELVFKLKDLIGRAGMTVRDGSITDDNPNGASDEDYIKEHYLKPRIEWASTMVVLITHATSDSPWVNWEVQYAAERGKKIVGVFAQGATDADVPVELRKCVDAPIVGWQSERVVDAIHGEIPGHGCPPSE